jgi:hypothetical protein
LKRKTVGLKPHSNLLPLKLMYKQEKIKKEKKRKTLPVQTKQNLIHHCKLPIQAKKVFRYFFFILCSSKDTSCMKLLLQPRKEGFSP